MTTGAGVPGATTDQEGTPNMRTTTVTAAEHDLADFVLLDGTDEELHALFERLALRDTSTAERRHRRRLAELSPDLPFSCTTSPEGIAA